MAINRGLKCIFCQCMGHHVLSQLIVALVRRYWLVCWLSICFMKAPFFSMMASWWQRNERQILQMYSTSSQSHSMVMKGGQIGVRCCLDFHLQNTPERGAQGVQVWQIWRPIYRSQAVWAGTESAQRRIFHQDMSSGPRGPYAASKALGSNQLWPVRQRKPTIRGLNLQYKTPESCSCQCWGPSKSLYVAVLRKALSDVLVASDLHTHWGIAPHQPPFIPSLGPLPIGFCQSSP
jgi:hypothetical protein